ncbi:CLUMA_CG001475, isoform A [Clunio marinus]|uniref:CLUMA_CG001475, isoform A n=1 Tax=Clunio marinus TaxID=568069 RepID=A0A1J1HJU7_9DIPT|nr:CLUMA_CG001475, isoform A [Clunio marinus]
MKKKTHSTVYCSQREEVELTKPSNKSYSIYLHMSEETIVSSGLSRLNFNSLIIVVSVKVKYAKQNNRNKQNLTTVPPSSESKEILNAEKQKIGIFFDFHSMRRCE